MKNVIIVLITILGVTSCQKQKIGYVDNGKVINEVKEKKDIEAKYEALNKSFTLRADSISKTYQSEYQELKTKAARMSQNKQQGAIQAFQAKAQHFQQTMQGEQQKLQTDYQTEIDSVISKMKTTIKDYGKTNGYNFIIGTTETIGTVLYAEESSDLTALIIKEIDANYKQ